MTPGREMILYFISGVVIVAALASEKYKEEYWQEKAAAPSVVTVHTVYRLCAHINEKEVFHHDFSSISLLDCDDLFPEVNKPRD